MTVGRVVRWSFSFAFWFSFFGVFLLKWYPFRCRKQSQQSKRLGYRDSTSFSQTGLIEARGRSS
jgi:hypothetical protein